MKKVILLMIFAVSYIITYGVENNLLKLIGGRIGYSQIIGVDNSCNIRNIISPRGGVGNIIYSWEKREDGQEWQRINNQSNSSCIALGITQTTQFRRKVTRGDQIAYSNSITAYVCRSESDLMNIYVNSIDTLQIDVSRFYKNLRPTWDGYSVTLSDYTSNPSPFMTINWSSGNGDIPKYMAYLTNTSNRSRSVFVSFSGFGTDWDGPYYPWSKYLNFSQGGHYTLSSSDIVFWSNTGEEYAKSLNEGESTTIYLLEDDFPGMYNDFDNLSSWWQYSEDQTSWTDVITNQQTSQSYNTGPLFNNLYFRRCVSDGFNIVYSNVFPITVNMLPMDGGIVVGNQTLNFNDMPSPINNVTAASGGAATGNINYYWEGSYDNTDWWQIADYKGMLSYHPVIQPQTTYYRRVATKNNNTSFSNTIIKKVILYGGTVSVSKDANSLMFNIKTANIVRGGTGLYVYQWQSSNDEINWQDIAGANAEIYSFIATHNVFLRRKVICVEEVAYSNIVFILNDNENYIAKTTMTGDGSSSMINITYYDGLGRPMQSVDVGGSPEAVEVSDGRISRGDIIAPIVYDAMGRDDAKSYLPYVSTKSGSCRPDAETAQSNYYSGLFPGETHSYVQKDYELSPLNRVLASHNVGRGFRDNGKKVVYGYDANIENEVPLIRSSIQGEFKFDGYYNPATLFKNSITNEDGTTTTSYVDLQERTIMTRTIDNSNGADIKNVDTYYVYNDKGLLAWVVPPMAMEQIVNGHNYTKSDNITKSLCYMYTYDGRNRVVEKRLPGAESVYMIYDNGDRLIAMQDGNNRAESKWIVSQYDNHNRLMKQWYTLPSELSGITAESLPMTTIHTIDFTQLSASDVTSSYFYDDYANLPTANTLSFAAVEGVVSTTDKDERVKSYKVYDKLKVLGTDNTFIERAYYYDYKGRIIQTVEKNHLGGISRYSTKYDFIGNTLASHESHEIGGQTTTLLTQNTLDHRGRVLKTTTTLNDDTPATVDYTYNELGQLTGKTYGGEGGISETLAYNIQGWITEQNSDLFSSKLKYYTPTKPNTLPSYTGNITEWEWEHKGDNAPANGLSAYAFNYDRLSRLTDSHLFEGDAETPSKTMTEQGLTYDLNGNIITLKRYGDDAETVDNDFTYSYSGNRLTSLSDIGIKNNSSTYGYDSNGSMTTDSGRGLEIRYNYLNLVSDVRDGDELMKAKYAYSTDGTKLSVKDVSGHGYDYLGSLIYQTTTAGRILELAQFKEGVIKPNEGTNYFMRDHLGSTRVVANLATNDIVQQRNDYYPFGMKHEPANGVGIAASTNRFLFSGKELQTTGNLKYLDFGARMYDSYLGRWHVNDPLLEKYYPISPMVYAANNPVKFVDKMGLEIRDAKTGALYWENGQWTKFANSSSGAIMKSFLVEMRSTPTGAERFEVAAMSAVQHYIGTGKLPQGTYGQTSYRPDINGNFKQSRITIDTENNKDKAKEYGVTHIQAIASTIAHELRHTEKPNVEMSLKTKQMTPQPLYENSEEEKDAKNYGERVINEFKKPVQNENNNNNYRNNLWDRISSFFGF